MLLLGCWQTWTVKSNEDCADPATWYADGDEDGSGSAAYTLVRCNQPDGYVAEVGDCDDDDATRYPGAQELCDEVDQDCDGEVDEDGTDLYYIDADGDGWGDETKTAMGCSPPAGAVSEGGDCDDADDTRHPGADEVCDEVDQDCDGDVDEEPTDGELWYSDQDGDGWGDQEIIACEQPPDSVDRGGDCLDEDSAVHPAASEQCDNGLDDNCDGKAEPCAWSGTYKALEDATTWAYGFDADSYHGWSLASGDLDGNGQQELLVGSLGLDSQPTISRLEYPFADAVALQTDVPQILGSPGSLAGWAIAVLDANGDGQDDLLAGDVGAERIWLLYGPVSSGFLGGADVLNWEGLGYSVDGGDVDDDGTDELCSGAPTASAGAGEVLWAGDLSDPNRVVGAAGDAIGDACLLVDLDGDGVASLVIGGASGGVVAVFEKAPDGFVSVGDADVVIRGEYGFGYALATGDLDGDGTEDLLAGSPLESSSGGSRSGSAYLFLETAGVTKATGSNARYDGPTPSDEAGQGISTGDADGDGTIDLMVGLPGDAADRGSSSLLLTPKTSGVIDLSDADARFRGFEDGGYFGAVGLMVDLDGDGDADPVMSAPYEYDNSGGVWIWLSPGI